MLSDNHDDESEGIVSSMVDTETSGAVDRVVYGFRNVIVIADKVHLDIQSPEMVLCHQGKQRVSLRSLASETNIADIKKICLRGTGYPEMSEAQSAAREWRQLVQRAFVRLRVCADFGPDRISEAMPFSHVVGEVVADQLIGPVYRYERGIQVFQDNDRPGFIEFGANAAMVIRGDQLSDTVADYAANPREMTDDVRHACALYGDAAFQASPMSQVVMLTAAVEALIDQRPRSDAECALIEQMIGMVDSADVDVESGERLKNALRGLKTESVRAAAKRLCDTVDDKYDSVSAKKFFDRAYNVRSSLAHGGGSDFDSVEVRRTASILELLISELVSTVISADGR